MTQKNRPSADDEKSLLESRHTGKKPYQKPEFRSERVFETMALACGKVAVQFQCRRRRRSS
jgi:hypothetical protein